MKYAIPWVLVVILFGGIYFLYSTGVQKEAELARLQQNPELAALRAENERLKQAPDANVELLRLRKEVEELPRLRSEVGQLRAENQRLTAELQKAQGQHAQTQQQMAAENQSLRAQALAAQAQARATTCGDNLLEIASAKQRWATEKGQTPNAFPTLADIAPYLPNHALPVCPGGGTYTINSMSSPPTCSVAGHSLPKQD
jgi:hypothetical protein